MLTSLLLPGFTDIQLECVEAGEKSITLHMISTQMPVQCPVCNQQSRRVHSRYVRRLADLPWAEVAVTLRLLVRRFRCANAACKRRLFTERFGDIIAPVARRTSRLLERIRELGLAMGGELGSRSMSKLGIVVSPDTVLRLVRGSSIPTGCTSKAVGIDDWAHRKGHSYGTILVDLERSAPLDLLPDRDPATVIEGLRRHSGTEIITRDRYPAFAQASHEALPAATQVADRFHLLQNCGDALQRVCERNTPVLRQVTKLMTEDQTDQPVQQPTEAAEAHLTTDLPEPATDSRAWRRFCEVKELQQQGLSCRAISQRLHLNRRTVQKYFQLSAPPVKVQRIQPPSSITPYLPYLRQRIVDGCRNRRTLYLELRELGFRGQYHTVWRASQALFSSLPDKPVVQELRPNPQHVLTARKAAWLLMQPTDQLSDERRKMVDLLTSSSDLLAEAGELALAFRMLINKRKPDQFDAWLERADASTVPEFRHFAAGLRRDYAAVKAGLTLAYSNGPVEGHINRLKLIKRCMYGRAKFDLLRIRVLCRV